WIIAQQLYVGNQGPANRLLITNGGFVQALSAMFGDTSTSVSNLLAVVGTNSILRVGSLSEDVKSRNNSITVANGGNISSSNVSLSADSVTVTGPGSAWTNTSMFLGSGVISNGGVLYSSGSFSAGGSSSGFVVTDPGSLLRATGVIML